MSKADAGTQADFGDVRDKLDRLAEQQRKEALEGGARYHNPVTTTVDEAGEDLAHDRDHCQNCGEPVDETTRRTFGDNDDILWHCFECVTATMMKKGAGTMQDIERRCPNTGHLGGRF